MKDFGLKGYMLPLSPSGKSSVVDAPPWHYGGEVLHIAFKADPERVRALIPPPLEMGPNPGEGIIWFTDWVSVSDSHPDLAYLNPERANYRECLVLLSCRFEGTPGYAVPHIWVDNDFTL
ncbi:MAG: acetoacetate decarboxylase family protein, partial [Acidobacteriota bacterium]